MKETIEGLFLDDIRTPRSTIMEGKYINWEIVRTYDDFVSYIERCSKFPDIITFDHDLNDVHTKHVIGRLGMPKLVEYSEVEKTGYHAAKWLCEYYMDKGIKLPDILTVHSANPCGADNIMSVLTTYAKVTGQNPKIYKTVW